MLICTDIHADWERLLRAFDYGEENDNVDMIMSLGDVCDNPNQLNSFNWSKQCLRSNKPILSIIGNHDAVVLSESNKYSDSQLLEYFFSDDLQTHNGESHNGDSLYWYKDFTSTYNTSVGSETKTLRLIAMNQHELGDMTDNSKRSYVYYSQDQIDWLIDLLDNTDENTYVVIATHCVPTSLFTRVESVWSDGYNVPGGSDLLQFQSDKDMLCKIVNSWINGTNVTLTNAQTNFETISINHTFESIHNTFVGWICGHAHLDSYCVSTNYPNQKIIVFNCTTSGDEQQSGDLGRSKIGKAQDCVTLFSYDWINNKIRLVRLGADMTVDGILRRMVVI